ncbi:fimbrillin family protein, partial [Dysgonomonas termitidis]
PEITYTVPILPEKQEDLLVAVSDELSAGTVPVNFKHALSRVLFRARSKKADVPVKIEEVTLMNLYTTGTWKLEPDVLLSKSGVTPNADDDYSSGVPTDLSPFTYATYNTSYATAQMPEYENAAYLTYTSGSNEHFWQVDPTKQDDYTVDLSASNTVGKDYTSITGKTQGLMVMPQATAFTGTIASPNSTDFYVQVKYSVGGPEAQAKTKNIRVYDWWKKAWGSFTFEPGKQYTFDMEVDPEGMITLSVGQVAAFTYPPIDVPKKFAVGDIVPLGVDGAMALVTQVDASDDSHGWALGATPLLAYSTSTPDATSFPASGPAYYADWANAAIDLSDYPMYEWFVEANHGERDQRAWVEAKWATVPQIMDALVNSPASAVLSFWIPAFGLTPSSGNIYPVVTAPSVFTASVATFADHYGEGGNPINIAIASGTVSTPWAGNVAAHTSAGFSDWTYLPAKYRPQTVWFYLLRF